MRSSKLGKFGFELDKGDVEKDEEGLRTMEILGENMAWLLKKNSQLIHRHFDREYRDHFRSRL